MAHLMISLLGSFRARLDGQPIPQLHSDTLRGLLAYLLVEADREHARMSLGNLFWPEQPDTAALSNLRYVLSDLRRALGDTPGAPATPVLLVTRQSVRLNPAADCWSDVMELERSHATLASAHHQQVNALADAAALYRGPFLEGLALPGSTAFEDWLFWTREQFQRKAVEVLYRVVDLYNEAGCHEAAQAAARRQVQLEPLDEAAHRQLMQSLALGGQRTAAITQYQACRRVLAQELGLEPGAETVALAEAIRAGALAPPVLHRAAAVAPAVLVAAPPAPASPPGIAASFVAREPELAELARHLDAALAGDGRVVFITGDAGSGKSALMQEFVSRALTGHADLVAAAGSCNAATGAGDPYLPFREVLQMLAGDIEARRACGAITPEHARRLWSLLPVTVQTLVEQGAGLIDSFVPGAELLLRADSIALSQGQRAAWHDRLTDAMRKREMAATRGFNQPDHTSEQVSRVLQGIARHRPLLVLLDDLQWIDNPSVGLFFHLGRRLAGSRILVLAAFRPTDVELGRDAARHPLAAVVNELRRDFGEIVIDLEQAEGRAFVDALIDGQPNRLSAAFRDTLHHHTGGHALFAIEALRGLQARGDLVRDAAGCWVEGAHLDWTRLPPRVEAVIAERIDRLPEDAQMLLATASVEGEEFTGDVLARVLGRDKGEVLRLLSDTLGKQHRLVRAERIVWLDPSNQSLARYRFQHFLFHQYLYTRLDPVECARLHRLTGEALEQLYGDQASEMALQLAWHFERAGLAAQAANYLRIAGYRALQMGACQEAAADFRRGLALLARLPDTPDRVEQEVRLQLAVGAAQEAVTGPGDAARASAVERALALSARAGGSRARIFALWFQADVCRGQGRFEAALELGRELLAFAAASNDRQTALLGHFTIGSAAYFTGALLEARTELEETLRLYDPVEDRALIDLHGSDVKGVALAWLAHTLWVLGYDEQSAACARESIDVARNLALPWTLAIVLVSIIWLRIHRGDDHRDLRKDIEDLQRLVDEKALEMFRSWVGVFDGWLLAQDGQVAEGIDQMLRHIRAWQTAGTPAGVPGLLAIVARVCLQAGCPAEGLAALADATELLERGIGRLYEAELYRLRGALRLAAPAGDRDAAEADFCKAVDVARQQQARAWELRATQGLARLWHADGRYAAGRELLSGIFAWFTEGFDSPDLQEASALLGESILSG